MTTKPEPTAPSDLPADAAGITPESLAQAEAMLRDVDSVIAEIERAKTGNEALDSRIHFGFRVAMERCADIGEALFHEGVSWLTVKQALDAQIPPFTTSLDAALEGEDITFVVHAARQRKWGAMQRTRRGEEILAWATTEPLARRLAAIKAWRARFAEAVTELQRQAEAEADDRPEPAPAPPAQSAPPGTAAAPRAAERGRAASEPAVTGAKKDWEVLF